MKPDRAIGFSGRKWPQNQSELAEFVDLLKAERVRSYLEIGALHGDTFHHIGMALPEGSRLVGVDLPGWKHGQPIGKHKDSADYLCEAVSELNVRDRVAHVIIGDSHAAGVVEDVRRLAPFDAVLIDGDHTPEGCLADWRNYGTRGRLIAFHDITGIPAVRKVFHEAREGREWREIVSGTSNKGGFGIVWNC